MMATLPSLGKGVPPPWIWEGLPEVKRDMSEMENNPAQWKR